jgi:hypothetical protein
MTSLIRLRCPQCGKHDNLDINANIWVRLTDDGTDADLAASRDHEWNDASHIRCVSCGCSGMVGDFQPNEYMAYFRTTAGPAEDIFVADTPEQALELARKAFSEDPGKFGFSPADCGYLKLQEIRIVNEHAKELLFWMTDEYRLQLAAPQLLKALEAQVEATREIIDAWDEMDSLPSGVQDIIQELDNIIEALEGLSEAVGGVLVSWENENSQLASAVSDLQDSMTVALKTIADAKGGAA